MNLVINYLLVGILFQFFMVWASKKSEQEEFLFTHVERILLVAFWPIGLLGVIYNIIKTLIFEE